MKVYLVRETYTVFECVSKESLFLFEVEDIIIDDILKHNNKYYVPSFIDKNGDVFVKEIQNFENNGLTREYTSSVTCPFCGYEDPDSWEY